MDTGILALTDSLSISGVLCLAAIPCLILVGICYSRGFVAGAGLCFIFFIVALLWNVKASSSISMDYVGGEYIANKSQTKWMKKNQAYISEEGCVFHVPQTYDGPNLFIPADELMEKNGFLVMKTTGEMAEDDDYYLYNVEFSPYNVAEEHGGSGLPQWLWHPSCPVWIFGIFSLPAMGLGALLKSKM